MKNDHITVDAKELRDAVKAVAKAIERRNTIPILGLMRLSAYDGILTLQGTNLDQEITTNIIGNGRGRLEGMVPPQILLNFLTAPSGEVKIVIVTECGDEYLLLENGRSKLNLRLNFPCEDMPRIICAKQSGMLAIPEAELHRLLTRVEVCISSEITRYYLNGVYIHGVDGRLALAATDGRRLMLVKTDFIWKASGFILPTTTVEMLLSMIDKRGNGSVQIQTHENAIIKFITKNGVIVTKAIDGKFPDYTRVIPKSSRKISVKLEPKDLRRFTTAYSAQINKALKIDPINGEITQNTVDKSMAVTTGIARGHGEVFGLNPALLKPMVAELGAVELTGAGVMEPFIIECDDPQTTCVIMPMRI